MLALGLVTDLASDTTSGPQTKTCSLHISKLFNIHGMKGITGVVLRLLKFYRLPLPSICFN